MGKQHNRRIFAGFYKRYDNKYIYVVAVVPDVDTGSQVVIFHEGIDACECKYYSMTKQSFCEMVEVAVAQPELLPAYTPHNAR